MSSLEVLTCSKCHVEQLAEEFYANVRYKNGIDPKCKSCKADASRAYYHRYYEINKQKVKERARVLAASRTPEERAAKHRRSRLSSHGVTVEWYAAALQAQDGCCAICKTTSPHSKHKNFYIDHDHNCCPGPAGCAICVRGLLCDNCNVGIGRFNDDPNLMKAAIDYLETYSGNAS